MNHALLRRAAQTGIALAAIFFAASVAVGQNGTNQGAALGDKPSSLLAGPQEWTSPEGLTSAMQVMLLLTVLSLAPAIILMTTSFVRVIVVLGLLRQALGTQQLPPTQVVTALSLFITLAVMTPTWKEVYDRAIVPYTSHEPGFTMEKAWAEGVQPIRKFLSDQISRAGNDDDVRLFLRYLPEPTDGTSGKKLEYVYYGAKDGQIDVPLSALLPGFLLSELKIAFVIGFQIFLPFLILDLVVSSITISMGMLMLSPAQIALPLKLLLFVLLDGWHLVVEMLLASFLGSPGS